MSSTPRKQLSNRRTITGICSSLFSIVSFITTEEPTPNIDNVQDYAREDFNREIRASLHRTEAKLNADKLPSIAQVLEEDIPSPAAIQGQIDRIMEKNSPASSSVSPSNDSTSPVIISLPRRDGAQALRTRVVKKGQSPSSSPNLLHPTAPVSTPTTHPLTRTPSRLHSFFSSLSFPPRKSSISPTTPPPSRIPRPSPSRPMSLLTLPERIAFAAIRTRLLGEMTEEHLDAWWDRWPELKSHPFYCSPRVLARYGFVEPEAGEAVRANEGKEKEKEKAEGRGEEAKKDKRGRFIRRLLEEMEVQERFGSYQIRFEERGDVEEPVSPRTRVESAGDEVDGGEEGKGGEQGKRTLLRIMLRRGD